MLSEQLGSAALCAQSCGLPLQLLSLMLVSQQEHLGSGNLRLSEVKAGILVSAQKYAHTLFCPDWLVLARQTKCTEGLSVRSGFILPE